MGKKQRTNYNNNVIIVIICISCFSLIIQPTYTQPIPPPTKTRSPRNPFSMGSALNNVIGNVLGLLTGHPPGKGHVYPFPLECEKELKHQCSSVLRVCHRGEKCNLECMATNPPNISKACRRSHPCALSAEKLCERVQDSDGLFDCLKKNKDKLSPECLASEACLDPQSKKCKLIEANEWGGGDATQHGPNGIRVTNKACECKENSCKTHLHHPFCRPCGPHCVNNPLCGYSKYFCAVVNPKECNEPYAHHLGDCSGPFPRFNYCEESIEVFLKTPDLPKAEKTRCNAQLRLHQKDPKICPPPSNEFVPYGARNTKIRPCKPEFSIKSFMRNVFHRAFDEPPMPPPLPGMWMERHRHHPPPPPPLEGFRNDFGEADENERFRQVPPMPRPFKEGHQNAFDNIWRPHRPHYNNNIQMPIRIKPIGAAPFNQGNNAAVKKELTELKSLRKNFENEMARERKEIDRERKEVQLEKQVVTPTSSWNVMNNMHLKNIKQQKPRKSAATNSFTLQNMLITCLSILTFALVEYFE